MDRVSCDSKIMRATTVVHVPEERQPKRVGEHGTNHANQGYTQDEDGKHDTLQQPPIGREACLHEGRCVLAVITSHWSDLGSQPSSGVPVEKPTLPAPFFGGLAHPPPPDLRTGSG